jgi:RNA polymerase sigma-70 factor (ECF subfamily)
VTSPLEDADDPALVAALVAGDPHAPGVLWRRFAPMVFRMLRRLLGSRHEVEDLAQEVFLCTYRKARQLRNPQALRAFIISTTVLTARYEVRRTSSRRQLAALVRMLPREGESVAGRAEARAALLRFYCILDRLKPHDRALFVLRFVEEMGPRDVAATMGMSLATTKRRLTRIWAKVVLRVERDPVLSPYRRTGEDGEGFLTETRGSVAPQSNGTHSSPWRQ